jgi:hypothetical protein
MQLANGIRDSLKKNIYQQKEALIHILVIGPVMKIITIGHQSKIGGE